MTHTTGSVVVDTAPRVRVAVPADCDEIYRLRHETYAGELGQHERRDDEHLTDALDADNVYVVVECGAQPAGFVSMSNPASARLSLDKYVPRADLPLDIDATVFKMRLLTIAPPLHTSFADRAPRRCARSPRPSRVGVAHLTSGRCARAPRGRVPYAQRATASLVAGAGSSALIYLALRKWLTSRSRVLLLGPDLRGIRPCPAQRHRLHCRPTPAAAGREL